MEDTNGTAAPAQEQEEEAKQNRRRFLTGLAGGGAALALRSLVSAGGAKAASGDDMVVGSMNFAQADTWLTKNSSTPFAALFLVNNGPAPALQAETQQGMGISGAAVFGKADADLGIGVFGTGDVGVQGDAPSSTSTQIGVKGTAEGPKGVGVQGTGFKGVEGKSGNYGVYGSGFFGVYGTSASGAGVLGDSTAAAVPGVVAKSEVTGGLALQVQGFPQLSTAGRATVAKGKKQVTVTLAGVVATDTILATVQGSGSVSVKDATAGAGKLTIAISKVSTSPVTVGYLVIRT